ncbi:MFS transporter [Longispora sp. K20-0274]|uniref:MFS transporter n=1 Tax=Longispora sp. K20-0274 TaxID=3088255 RepID=UPI00399957F9
MNPYLPGPVPPDGSGVRPIWPLAGPAVAGSLGAFLLTVAVGTEWTAIQRDMGLSTSVLGGILLAYLLPAVLALPVGVLLGGRWPTAVALPAGAVLVLGSLVTAFAPGGGPLLVGRAVTGFGAGLAWGVAAALVVGMGTRRVGAAAVVGGLVLAGLVAGPVVGAVLAEAASWRVPFMLAVPVGAVAFVSSLVSGIVAGNRRAPQPTGGTPAGPWG